MNKIRNKEIMKIRELKHTITKIRLKIGNQYLHKNKQL